MIQSWTGRHVQAGKGLRNQAGTYGSKASRIRAMQLLYGFAAHIRVPRTVA
jgi:hypothetical protein